MWFRINLVPKKQNNKPKPFLYFGERGRDDPLGSTSSRSEALLWPVEGAVPWLSGPCPLGAESQLHLSCSLLNSSELGELTLYGWVNESEAHKH